MEGSTTKTSSSASYPSSVAAGVRRLALSRGVEAIVENLAELSGC